MIRFFLYVKDTGAVFLSSEFKPANGEWFEDCRVETEEGAAAVGVKWDAVEPFYVESGIEGEPGQSYIFDGERLIINEEPD